MLCITHTQDDIVHTLYIETETTTGIQRILRMCSIVYAVMSYPYSVVISTTCPVSLIPTCSSTCDASEHHVQLTSVYVGWTYGVQLICSCAVLLLLRGSRAYSVPSCPYGYTVMMLQHCMYIIHITQQSILLIQSWDPLTPISGSSRHLGCHILRYRDSHPEST